MPRLRRSDPHRTGLSRRRRGSGFGYLDVDGTTLRDPDARARLEALAIPPAWQDVWISPDALGHIQAVGTDDAGRRQYLYHPRWREGKDRLKFERALALAAVLPSARRQVTRDLRRPEPDRQRALAAAFRILDTASPRMGNARYLERHGSHGLATMLGRHVHISGDRIELLFPGKSGQEWTAEFVDQDLAALLRITRRGRGGKPALAWRDERGWHALSPEEINEELRERTGDEVTAKDFRTLRGTLTAALALAALAREEEAAAAKGTPRAGTARGPRRRSQAAVSRAASTVAREVAEVLGNTPAVARRSYIDPRLFDRFRAGEVIEVSPGSSGEAALRRLLG